MRWALAAAAAIALAALAGCGDDDEDQPAASRWNGPPPAQLGRLPVDEFNRYADATDAVWKRSPALIAAEFARLDRAQAATTSVVARTPPEGGDSATVDVTLEGLLDDSIRATRITARLRRADGGTWQLASARRTQRCHPGRGQQRFQARRCR